MFSFLAVVGRVARWAFLVAGVWAVADIGRADFSIFSAGGDSTPASIQSTVDSFRAALGDPNNGNAPGPLSGGRREINWDGGGSMSRRRRAPHSTAFRTPAAVPSPHPAPVSCKRR
jgi:hypothetical protein